MSDISRFSVADDLLDATSASLSPVGDNMASTTEDSAPVGRGASTERPPMGFQEDEQNVVDYLATKFEGRMTCSVCGGSGIHYEGRVCVFRVGDDTNEVDLDAPVGLNLVQLVCPNCGHILHFNGTIAEGPWSAS